MPSSFDHCKDCSFSKLPSGTRREAVAEHTVNMDLLHGRRDTLRGFSGILSAERLEASQKCAQRILEGSCNIYQVNETHSTIELIEKEE